MNGLYKAIYSVPGDRNEGIVFIDNGKIYGSDRTHAFYGTYTISGEALSANLTRIQHAHGGYNMGGGGNELTITGTLEGDKIRGKGTIPGVPVKMDILLQQIKAI
ncbi:hypothetical protein HMPREF0326_05690 [Desulfovibrio sp. 3_1_syn3]|uniref:hypothetical protein n=1 Tax=Desulfovibrio sp. 3_1_syn3 TaxID=457398 RepID=UPI00039019E2|nr:hypothetical protein [Desulfovibrio sp. 3_1_syn3]EQN50827.1 hypothetical protein HMPREF0326_05690 [Desulfovibrio sp. 3_1_syn3]